MIILSNKRLSEKGKAGTNSQGKIVRTYSQKRLVESSADGSTYACGNALGYVMGQTFYDDASAVMTVIDIDRKETIGRYFWDLSLEWSTEGTPTYQNSIDPTKQ
jgi:hypothetical protein